VTWDEAVECAARGFLSASNPKVEWELLSKATKLLWLRSADSALRALTAAGVAIVPREPTEEMMMAGGQLEVAPAGVAFLWSAALSAGEIAPKKAPPHDR
jgi:hypothetical protein